MVPSEHWIRPAASNDLAVPSLCICLLFVSVPLLVSVILCLTIIVLNAGSRRQWSAFLTTKKVLRYDACAVKSDFCSSNADKRVTKQKLKLCFLYFFRHRSDVKKHLNEWHIISLLNIVETRQNKFFFFVRVLGAHVRESFLVFFLYFFNYSAFRNFFPKLCLILKNRFLVRLRSNFQGKTLYAIL